MLNKGSVLCLDLNGFTLTGSNRVFYTSEKAVLNIMDSSKDQTGRMVGTGAAMSGGAIWIDPDSTVNLYSGIVTCDTSTQKTAHGGVICTKGNLNIYGGQILGANSNNNGGAIYVNDATAQLNIYGGQVIAGTCGGFGECVTVNTGMVKVAGDAIVDEICYLEGPTVDNFQVVATAKTPVFTGKVILNDMSLTADGETAIGSFTAQWSDSAVLAVSDGTEILLTQDNKLVAWRIVQGAAGVIVGDAVTSYQTLEEAIANVGVGYVILGQDVEKLTVSKDITVDLNGKNVASAEVLGGATLTLKDRRTDDYTVADDIYGVVGYATGKVVAADNYLAVTDAQGTSYHRYSIMLKSVVLRPERSGIYYKSEFLGDSIFAEQVETFGVALNIYQVPDETNMTPGTYSSFTPDAFGGENTSTALVDIMDTTDFAPTNAANAQKKVYGRSYIKLSDGSYLFSDIVQCSLQELTELISKDYWSKLTQIQKDELWNMYDRFQEVMVSWDIDNIKAYAR